MLQVVHSDLYSLKADRQYSSSSSGIFSRGSIFFKDKDGSLVSAASLQSGFVVTINPKILKNLEEVYEKINAITPIDREKFFAKALKPSSSYEEVASRVESSLGEKINSLNITGLKAYKERWRFYPGGSTAAHIVGMMGYQGDDFAGRYGLERQFESILKRSTDSYGNFFAQIFSNIKAAAAKDLEGEADIVTTIEPTIQTSLEKTLVSINNKLSSEATGGIILDPKTGEIYAMEMYPTFDPNHPELLKNISVLSNPLVENVYEMGSIIKSLTVAAGIDAGVITATSTYYDSGFLIVNNKKISNFDGKERGIVSMQDVLSQSLNVGAAHVAKLLGNKRLTDYFYAFGLNEKTGIDLPNEGRNLMDNLKSPRDIEHFTASFGQGIAMTPISATRALATIANGGVMVSPHVVKNINYKIGVSDQTEITSGKRVIKRETAEELTRMMVHSVDKVLAGGIYKLQNYSIAVKTGTAQMAKEGGGGYYEDKFLHSFVGYFPAYNPKFFVFLYTIDPKGFRFSSETLTGPFMELAKYLINYYELPPDR